jgi:hypothetical protein
VAFLSGHGTRLVETEKLSAILMLLSLQNNKTRTVHVEYLVNTEPKLRAFM